MHVHSLVLDGAYFCDHARGPCASVHPFYTLPDWSVHDLKRVISSLDADIQKLLDDANDDDAEHEGVRACLQIGTSHVNDTMDVRASPKAKPVSKGLLVSGEYVALHVAPAFDGRDRPRLARQVKYMLRPPVALESISRTDTGNVRIEFKQATSYGKTSTEISPRQLIARLSALVPPPHFNVIRYRGVFTPSTQPSKVSGGGGRRALVAFCEAAPAAGTR